MQPIVSITLWNLALSVAGVADFRHSLAPLVSHVPCLILVLRKNRVRKFCDLLEFPFVNMECEIYDPLSIAVGTLDPFLALITAGASVG